MRMFAHAVLALMTAALLAVGPAAQAVTIKLATLAPEGSTWHKALRQMGEEWEEISNGEVDLKIYAGGVVGNETVMLRKMRIGQLHAGAFTNIGLMEIDPSSQAINTPMLLRDYDELDYVMERMSPTFEERVQAQGYRVLSWSDAGWARLFSKQAITDPAHRDQLEIFAWEGDPAAVKMYQEAGFKPVVIPATDVVPSLQSGLIDSFPSTPLGALAFQWFGLAPNMLDVPWAPLLGAIVITDDAWASIPEQYREDLMAASRRIGEETREDIRKQDRKAIVVMKKYGLTVNEVDDATFDQWVEVAKKTWPVVRTEMVDAEIFDRVKTLAEEYRAEHPADDDRSMP